MPIGKGSLNSLGCPVVEIEVAGPLPNSEQKFTALIDTGFSGFLSLPTIKAFPVGLVLHGTTTVVLADGNKQSKFTCLGVINFCEKSVAGTIIIEPNGDEVLVGMDFLKKFEMTLFVDPDSGAVGLIPSADVRAAVKPKPLPPQLPAPTPAKPKKP